MPTSPRRASAAILRARRRTSASGFRRRYIMPTINVRPRLHQLAPGDRSTTPRPSALARRSSSIDPAPIRRFGGGLDKHIVDRFAIFGEAAYTYGYTSFGAGRRRRRAARVCNSGCDLLKNTERCDVARRSARSRSLTAASTSDDAHARIRSPHPAPFRSFVADGIADICFGHPKSNSLPASVLRALADEITARRAARRCSRHPAEQLRDGRVLRRRVVR